MFSHASAEGETRQGAVSGDALPDGGIRLCRAERQERVRLERFIAERFAAAYGAELHRFMPRLFGTYDDDGQLHAAFGMRSAAEERLFLECYLDEPVEQLVSRRAGEPVLRQHIAEVGNLAGASPGALRELIPLLTRLLHRQSFHWVVFTGAARLCNGFSRLGLPLSVMAPAPIECLPVGEREHWGNYYRHSPSVMLGDVRNGWRQLEEMASSPRALAAALAPVAKVGAP
ncbi:MAG TPA: thermostable hemolysin [Solimonas sp.]